MKKELQQKKKKRLYSNSSPPRQFAFSDTLQNGARVTWRRQIWIKSECFFSFAHKYSCSFVKLRLNPWCHMDYFTDLLATFLDFDRVRTLAVYGGSESEWKSEWSDIRPSMVTHTRNLCSAFNPSKVHTHTPWTHTRSSGQPFMLWRPGAVEGSVPCSRAPQSWYWGWRERCTFTPPTYNSCWPETRTHNLSIMSPTL